MISCQKFAQLTHTKLSNSNLINKMRFYRLLDTKKDWNMSTTSKCAPSLHTGDCEYDRIGVKEKKKKKTQTNKQTKTKQKQKKNKKQKQKQKKTLIRN